MLSNTLEILPSAMIGAASSYAVQKSIDIYEKLTGNAYSKEDIKKLAELKRVYQETLNIPSPVTWELDEKHCPTHHLKKQQWDLHVKQLMKSKRLTSCYHYQSDLITNYASTYLHHRSERFIGAGNAGDLIEQFLGDWIHFAVNVLPTLGFDDESINKIKQRIQYMEQVQKHDSLFQFFAMTRVKNKMDTMEMIRQQLHSCLSIAERESLRQGAREKLDNCRSDMAALLLSCLQSMYYARKTSVHEEPLELIGFVAPDTRFLSSSAKNLYTTKRVQCYMKLPH